MNNRIEAADPGTLRQMAADQTRKADESWERSDTDGFLSQWACNLTAQLYRVQADLIENCRGLVDRVELFTLAGDWVPAQVVQGIYGRERWMVRTSSGTRFLPYLPARRATLTQKGYVEGIVRRKGKAEIMANGTGLSGAATARVVVVPVDPMVPPDEIITPDRWVHPKGTGSGETEV